MPGAATCDKLAVAIAQSRAQLAKQWTDNTTVAVEKVLMQNFTPGSAALGGALIGLASALLWLANGRIAGISGIVGGLLKPQPGEVAWRVAFLAGLVGAPLAYALLQGTPTIMIHSGYGTLIVAGLLVGFGSRLGGGCTSGHGVSGLARLSRRSITATALFMLAAAVTVFIARHVLQG